jgi:diaminopimelate epimerase
MAACRAVYSRVDRIDPERQVVVRNAGGMATVSLKVRQGRWHPVLEGNATFVYRADVDPAAPVRPAGPSREPCDEEVQAYAALEERNAARLRTAGVDA